MLSVVDITATLTEGGRDDGGNAQMVRISTSDGRLIVVTGLTEGEVGELMRKWYWQPVQLTIGGAPC